MQLAAIENHVGSFSLADGDVLRMTGKDCLAALDRVVSQEVKSLSQGDGRLALLLAPKGQFRAIMAVFREDDGALLLAPEGRGSELAASLGPYLRFSRVTVEPLAWDGGAMLVVGPAWPVAAASAGIDQVRVSAGGCVVAGVGGKRLLWLGRTFAGTAGAVAVAEDESVRRRLDDALAAAGAVVVVGDVLDLARIRVGFPAWGHELTETVLPPEVGLESLAVSYTKGCYVGQETIARLKTYGHPNRALVGVRQIDGPDAAPALPLALAAAGEEKVRGQLTSAGRHPALGWVGLALIRRELAAPGSRLSGAGRVFEVVALPLW